jgi:hypothetical protein
VSVLGGGGGGGSGGGGRWDCHEGKDGVEG